MKTVAILSLTTVSAQASASSLALYPVQTGDETPRYNAGVPVLSVITQAGGLQVQPLPMDHGHVAFGISVYNNSGIAQNFGAENIRASVGGQDVALLTVDQLQHQAKRRAAWSKFGMIMLTGVAAGLASNAHTTNTAHTSVRTPRGTYTARTTYRDYTLGAQAAGDITYAGARKIDGIQNNLDFTLSNLSDSVIRTTTLDPSSSYGGIIILDTLSRDKLPQDIRLNIVWAGAAHPFVFRLTRAGQNMPAAYTAGPPVQQATFSLASAPGPSLDLDGPPQPSFLTPPPLPVPLPPSEPLTETARLQLAYEQGAALARAQLAEGEVETAAKIRAWQQRQ